MSLEEALKEAYKASGEVPIGAVLVYQNKIVARAHNLVETEGCALNHAEFLCLQEGSKILKTKYLTECDLYVTLEPCAMCAGAIALSRIRRVYFGAYDPKGGFVDNNARIFDHTLHKPEIYGGIMANECSSLLSEYFKGLRAKLP